MSLRGDREKQTRNNIRIFFAYSHLPLQTPSSSLLIASINRISQVYDVPNDTTQLPSDIIRPKIGKRWLKEGLYAGTKAYSSALTCGSEHFPLPIFSGKDIIDIPRDFRLRWNLLARSEESATKLDLDGWRRLNKSTQAFGIFKT